MPCILNKLFANLNSTQLKSRLGIIVWGMGQSVTLIFYLHGFVYFSFQNQYGMGATRATIKPFTPPLPATGAAYHMIPGTTNGVKAMTQKAAKAGVPAAFQHQQQRQPSPPVVVRHVFTSGQGIPVTMAVLPQPPNITPEVSEYAVQY